MAGSSQICKHNDDSKCQALPELNSFEDKGTARYPQGDVMNFLRRGAIEKDWNAGLRNPQSKKLAVDVYNGGCRDTWGCVPTGPDQLAPDVPGFACPAGVSSMGPEMRKAYAYLNKPFLADGYEFHPPEYMMGIKDAGVNSVDGWQRMPDGSTRSELQTAAFLASVSAQPVPGCG